MHMHAMVTNMIIVILDFYFHKTMYFCATLRNREIEIFIPISELETRSHQYTTEAILAWGVSLLDLRLKYINIHITAYPAYALAFRQALVIAHWKNASPPNNQKAAQQKKNEANKMYTQKENGFVNSLKDLTVVLAWIRKKGYVVSFHTHSTHTHTYTKIM